MRKSKTSQPCLHTLIWTHLSTNESARSSSLFHKIWQYSLLKYCSRPGCSKPDCASPGLVKIMIWVLHLENLKIRFLLILFILLIRALVISYRTKHERKWGIFLEEKLILLVTFNPGIALTGFRITGPEGRHTQGNLLQARAAVTVFPVWRFCKESCVLQEPAACGMKFSCMVWLRV